MKSSDGMLVWSEDKVQKLTGYATMVHIMRIIKRRI